VIEMNTCIDSPIHDFFGGHAEACPYTPVMTRRDALLRVRIGYTPVMTRRDALLRVRIGNIGKFSRMNFLLCLFTCAANEGTK
jgi:hypothetical protein